MNGNSDGAATPQPTRRRGPGRPWKSGVSGNPHGRPRGLAEVTAAAAKHTGEALLTLVRLMRGAKREEVRVRAAEALLDRAWGRPALSVRAVVEAGVGEVSAAEWEALAVLRHAVRPALPAGAAVVEARALPREASALSGKDAQAQAVPGGEVSR